MSMWPLIQSSEPSALAVDRLAVVRVAVDRLAI